MDQGLYHSILINPRKLIGHIESRLNGNGIAANWLEADGCDGVRGSAVLFLLTQNHVDRDRGLEPCLLLNKRSQQVLQPGDLCCPGGGVAPADKVLWRLMQLPFSPLTKWPLWTRWRKEHREMAHRLALLWTTGLREAWEEMHLNPLRVSLLGPLAVQQLIMFKRRIFPLAAWVRSRQRLKPNWEVERIVHIPLRLLLDPGNYGRYRLTFSAGQREIPRKNDFPCFIHRGQRGKEILWGATFRITMDFLKRVFDFIPPDMVTMPVIQGNRGKTYLNGSYWEMNGLAKAEREHQ